MSTAASTSRPWCARTSRSLTIVARARNVTHYYQLYELGIRLIERETLDSALMSARSTLETLGWEPHQARTLALRFRRHNVEQLQAMAPHRKDEAKLIAAAKQGRQQLEELFALEREQAQRRQARSRLERHQRVARSRARDRDHALTRQGLIAGPRRSGRLPRS